LNAFLVDFGEALMDGAIFGLWGFPDVRDCLVKPQLVYGD
jgi:hypothetical protein